MDEWKMDGWMDGWMDMKAVLRIACSNHKYHNTHIKAQRGGGMANAPNIMPHLSPGDAHAGKAIFYYLGPRLSQWNVCLTRTS
jgi:hypothetical protein